MKKFLLLSLMLLTLGGATTVKAGKVYGRLTADGGFEATWNSTSETMGWNSVGNYYPNFRILLTGLPSGDITKYTKFHATLSNFSENATYVRLRIKSNDGSADHYADVNLVAGENNIDLVALRAAYPDCDFQNVKDITIWSPGSAEEGKPVDADHPASVKIQNVYLQSAQNIPSNSFGNEITSMNGITDGTKFVIGDGSKAMYFETSAVDAKNATCNNIPADSYYFFQITKVDGLDTDGDSNAEDDNYKIQIFNRAGDHFTHAWNLGSYLNLSVWSHTFAANGTADNYGTDFKYAGIWKITYSDGNGFAFKCASKKKDPNSDPATYETENRYLKINGTQKESEGIVYLKLYDGINFNANTELDKEDNPANDAIFDFANATGYDSETGILENGGWTFETPVDLSNWDYLIITLENTSRTTDTNIKITDNDGKYVEQNQYDPGSQPQMYFGTWNNHNAACISMDYLRINKGLDISQIKSLSFTGQELKISSVYLTDYENTKLGPSRGRYVKYVNGDEVRSYDAGGVGKYGTICLPYKASCAGAEVYSISGKTGSSISLTKVTGLLEAGKPYFYKASDVTGNDEDAHNVNFFRADLDTYDAATPGSNNGLIGTFTEINSEDAGIATSDFFVLSGNKIWNLEGATGEDKVTIGANKAYIKMSDVPAGGSAKTFLEFGDEEPNATDINAVEIDETLNGKFYDLQGREVENPTKGIYIVNGKKVVIK